MFDGLNIELIDNIQIIGLKCSKIHLTDSAGIEIHFGKMVPYKNPKLSNVKHGQIRVFSEFCDWRIITNNNLVVGPYDEEERFAETLNRFKGLKLIKIESINKYGDLQLIFNNQDKIEFWATSGEDDSWTIMGTNNFYVCNAGKITLEDNNEKPELIKEEIEFEELSKKTSERWSLKIPKDVKNNGCFSCKYFCPFAEKFYFWDYGICFNEFSIFDGKVVGVSSGCKKFTSKM